MDRRNENRPEVTEDRRKIERFTHKGVQYFLAQIKTWSKVMTAAALIACAFQIWLGINQGTAGVAFAVFLVSILVIFATMLYRLNLAISDYLGNESTANLEKTMERMYNFWVVTGIFSALFLALHIIFKL